MLDIIILVLLIDIFVILIFQNIQIKRNMKKARRLEEDLEDLEEISEDLDESIDDLYSKIK
jgi:prefoldin subunit 5